MYMNGRGPMTGGHRGPMGGPGMGPRVRMGYAPGMGFRPMRVYHRPMGFFPLGGLFILPALMFGGWIVLAVLGVFLGIFAAVANALPDVVFEFGREGAAADAGRVRFNNADDALNKARGKP